MDYKLSTIFIAYFLDLIFGDPQWWWHPTRILGRLIQKLEAGLNIDSINKKLAGSLLVILVVGVTVSSVWGILKLAKLLHPIFYYILSVLFIYFAVSIKDLRGETNKVYQRLKNGDIKLARENLSRIVARDTDKLDEKEIIRATVETVAESTMDGIVAPLFYTLLGGPVFAWGYKAINTLDSMVGYRSERFIDFGKAAAKLDELVNFIPARITSLLILISGWHYRKDWPSSFRWLFRYFFKVPKDNSEATEAAMASVLGVQLGGINFYNALPTQKRLIGDDLYPLKIQHIKKSIRIAYLSSALFIICSIFFIWLIERR